MEFFDCVFNRRTCRRFRQDSIPMAHLEKMVDAGRFAPTGFNHQRVRFAIIHSPGKMAETFEMTGWLTGKPPEGRRPVAYIAVMGENVPEVPCATYAVMLAAHALGYGSCWHGFGANNKLGAVLGLKDPVPGGILISLGRADEKHVVQDNAEPDQLKVIMAQDGTISLGKLARKHALIAVV